MAAYAALLTLTDTIDKIQHHPRLPVSLNKNQVESLTNKVTFLQKFLENRSHGRHPNEASDDLESRIAYAARTAEDVIESHVVDQVLVSSSGEKKFCKGVEKFYECLQKVVDDMDLIKTEVMDEMIKGTSISSPVQIRPRPKVSSLWDPQIPSFKGHDSAAGLNELLLKMMDRLIGQQSRRQVIPIAGMGGIGKTTLAKTVYSNALIQQHFDVRAWTTISKEYDMHQILVEVISQIRTMDTEDLLKMSENELKETLHKSLFGRRYLIILDDIWNIKAWGEIQLFFPDCSNGSQVVITTRLSNIASQANTNSYSFKMEFLDEDKSCWNLFCRVVFGEENCPLHRLEEIGKKVARGCKGLPLSICVVGWLLAKAHDEFEFWEYVAANLNLVVNLADNEHCLEILHMSYIQLPAHLKPCFFHMGVFREDQVIRVSEVIELWIDEDL